MNIQLNKNLNKMNKTPHYEEISHSILIRQLLLGGPAVTKYVP